MADLTQRHKSIPKVGIAEARMMGYPLYWTGEPCQRGHIEYRITSNYTCLQCSRLRKNAIPADDLIQAQKRREIEIRLEQLELDREYDYE